MDNARQYSRAKMFFLSFVGSFLVMGFMIVFLLMRMTSPMPQQTPAPVLPATVYLPSAADRLTLFGVVEGNDLTGDTFVLLGFYPEIGYMPVTVLPRQLGLQATTLQQLFDEKGAAQTAQVLEQQFGIAVDRTAVLPANGFSALLDRLGNVDFHLPVRLEDPNRGLVLAVGLHRFDGAKALALMNHTGWPGGEQQRCFLSAGLLTEAVNHHLTAVLGSESESLFKTAVNSCSSTDLSMLDYETYLPAARFMARLKASPGQALELSGSFDPNYVFLPDAATVELLHNTYKKAED